MPKLRSHSGAKKRFRRTAHGHFRHKRAGLRHLLTPMSAKRGRFLRGKNTVNGVQEKILERFLPYA